MLKKTTSLLMALLLCTALLLGCGQETTNSSQGDSSAESSSDAASSGADSGDSVSSYPLVDKTVTFNAVNTKSENVEESAACKAYEEITNVHINWTYWSMNDFVQNLTLAVTADTVPDILFNMVSNGTQGCTPSQINQWGNAGYFVNYMDYEDLIPDVLAALKESSRAAVSCYTDDGKMFLLPTWNWSYTGVGINLYYYTELAKEIGYNAPPETIDEFYDMLVKAQAEFGATDDEFYAYRAGSATAELEANYVFTAFGDFVQTGYDSIDLKTVEYAGMSDR